MGYVRMGGMDFPQKLFIKNINIFKEGLAHTSISCEQAFTEMFEYEDKIRSLVDLEANKRFKSLSKPNRDNINKYLVFFVLYTANYAGVIPGPINLDNYDENLKVYAENFAYLDEWIHKCIVFEQKKFDEKQTYRKIVELFKYGTLYKAAKEKATSMKKDHLDAFDYSLSTAHVGAREIIKINEIVNQSQADQEVGFKRVNNMITGAGFDTAAKETIPTLIQELVYKYDNNFGMEIKDINDPSLSREERKEEILKICRKEAMFHIEFERLHPFIDGNGRTGRIILSRNLIKQGLAPVLVTDVTMDKYKKYIDTRNYDEFAEWIMENSAQTLTPWVTELRMHYKIDPSSIDPVERKGKPRR